MCVGGLWRAGGRGTHLEDLFVVESTVGNLLLSSLDLTRGGEDRTENRRLQKRENSADLLVEEGERDHGDMIKFYDDITIGQEARRKRSRLGRSRGPSLLSISS